MDSDNYLPAFPKPSQKEGKIAMNAKARRLVKFKLFNQQGGKCAKCGVALTRKAGFFNSAELDHINPEPMGCAKNDSEGNHQVLCWKCNQEKGSKRS